MFKTFPFQNKAIDFLLAHKRALLGLDTGLGKSFIMLQTIKQERLKKILIIAPAFLRYNWQNEISKWLSDYDASFTIRSYTSFAKKEKAEKCVNGYDCVILDESHYVKNPFSKRAQNIYNYIVKHHRGRVIFSTATPVVKSAADLFYMLKCFDSKKFENYDKFCRYFCHKKSKPRKFGGGVDYYGIKQDTAPQLRKFIRQYGIRMRKVDVYADLPPKIITDIPVQIQDAGKVMALVKNDRIVDALVALGKSKAQSVYDFATLNREPTVIFTWHKEVATELAIRYADEGETVDVWNGDVSQKKRQEIKERFMTGKTDTLIATMAALSAGENLTRATKVIFAELPWSYAQLKQSADRCHRIGTENKVNEYRFIGMGTFDEQVLKVLNTKIEAAHFSVGHIQ